MEKEIITFSVSENDIFDIASSKKTKVNIKYVLLHTLPDINLRGRCITLPTLKNSIDNIDTSGAGELINLEHIMSDTGLGNGENEIVGFSSKTYLPDLTDEYVDTSSAESLPLIPKKSVPLFAEGKLWSRNSIVQKIVNQQKLGLKKWQVSVEISHNFQDGAFFFPDKKEFIPVKDASQDLLDCYSTEGIKSYQNRQTAFAWGGERGAIHIVGTGITSDPADTQTKLELCVASAPGEPIYSKGGIDRMFDLSKLSIEEINNIKFDLEEFELGTKWTRAYINDLSDSAFAIVSARLKKDTDDKSKYRGYSYKNADGAIDVSHLRNALARIAQMIEGSPGIGKSDFNEEELKSGQKKLIAAAKKEGIGDYASLVKWCSSWQLSNTFETEFGQLDDAVKETIYQQVVIDEKKIIPTMISVLGTSLNTASTSSTDSIMTKEKADAMVTNAVKEARQKWEDEVTIEKATQSKLQERIDKLTQEGFDVASEELLARIKAISIDTSGDAQFTKELDFMKSLRISSVTKPDTNSTRFFFPGGSFKDKEKVEKKESSVSEPKVNLMTLAR